LVDSLRMSLFGWFRKRKGFPFSDEDRAFSLQTRKENADIERRKRQLDLEERKLEHEKRKAELEADILEARNRISELNGTDEEEGSDGSDTDAMLMLLLTKVLGGNAPLSASASSAPNPPVATKISMTDEQIEEILASMPKRYVKLSRDLSDETLRAMILGKMPNVDDDTIQRAITRARNY